jgi:hypothetical protein
VIWRDALGLGKLIRRRVVVAVGAFVLVALPACGSNHELHRTTYSVADVRQAFAQHGVTLRESLWWKRQHKKERLALLLPPNGAATPIDVVWVDVSESFAKLSAAQLNRTGTRDSQIRNVEVMWEPADGFSAPVRAAIADLRASR